MTWLNVNRDVLPGVQPEAVAPIRELLLAAPFAQSYWPQGLAIDGTATRDCDNPIRVDILRAGLVMGRITGTNKYANSIFGLTTAALTGASTNIALPGPVASEISRRLGSSGTLKITGPAVASGTVRTKTATFSAIATSGGNDAVLVVGSGSGTMYLNVVDYNGVVQTTSALAYNDSAANVLAALNAVLGTNAVTVTGTLLSSPGLTIAWTGVPNYAGRKAPAVSVGAAPITATTVTGSPVIAVTYPDGITISALGTAEVVTITGGATQANGTFQINVGGQRTTALTYNVSAADMQTAVNLLTTVGTAGVSVSLNGYVYTLTFATALGDQEVKVECDSCAVASTFQPAPMAVAKTVVGADGRFVAGSVLQPVDGSETPVTLYVNKYGQSDLNVFLQGVDIAYSDLLVEGTIRTAMIVNYPADSSLRTWLKSAVRANGGHFLFDDDYIGTSI